MNDAGETGLRLLELLRREFEEVELEDQSHLHVGHGAKGGHYFAVIRSRRFHELSPLARQRLVMDVVRPLMDKEVHAFSMRCLPL